MASPIILGFKDNNGAPSSLASINTITVGIGGSFGEVTMPFVPLLFTPNRLADAIGAQNAYATGRAVLNNQNFYTQTYSGLPLSFQEKFWGAPQRVKKRVIGWSLGFSGGAIVAGAANAIKSMLRPLISRLVSDISLDMTQASVSGNALLHGMNGRDTYNMNEGDFRNANIFFINASMGCFTQAALNLAFIGNFPSCNITNPLNLPTHILDVYRHSAAWAVVPDAAVGAIFPGASISIIAS